jgi:hypothetical protein
MSRLSLEQIHELQRETLDKQQTYRDALFALFCVLMDDVIEKQVKHTPLTPSIQLKCANLVRHLSMFFPDVKEYFDNVLKERVKAEYKQRHIQVVLSDENMTFAWGAIDNVHQAMDITLEEPKEKMATPKQAHDKEAAKAPEKEKQCQYKGGTVQVPTSCPNDATRWSTNGLSAYCDEHMCKTCNERKMEARKDTCRSCSFLSKELHAQRRRAMDEMMEAEPIAAQSASESLDGSSERCLRCDAPAEFFSRGRHFCQSHRCAECPPGKNRIARAGSTSCGTCYLASLKRPREEEESPVSEPCAEMPFVSSGAPESPNKKQRTE